jgi:hypothetical protein
MNQLFVQCLRTNFIFEPVCRKSLSEFDAHGSVHLGNVCSIKGPTRRTYYVFFIPPEDGCK